MVRRMFRDFLSMTRMPFAFTQTLFIILGFLHAGGTDYFKLFLAVLALGPTFIYGGIYMLNDVADREFDRLHPKKRNRAITSGRISVRTVVLLSMFLIACGLAIAFYLGKTFVLISVAVLANNLLYAYGPRLKDRLYWGLLSCSMNYPLRFLAGSVVVNTSSIAILPAVMFFLIALNGFSSYRIYDRESMVSGRKKFKEGEEEMLAALIRLTALCVAIVVLILGYSKTPLAAVILAGCIAAFSEINFSIVKQGIDFFQLLRVHKTIKQKPELTYYPIMALLLAALLIYVMLKTV